jgi:predicted transcriptional regulator
MSSEIKVRVGTSLQEDLASVAEAWKQAEREESVQHHVVSFETWEAMSAALSPERVRLLRTLARQPARSVRALALALERDYSRVHRDVVALAEAGLVTRTDTGEVRLAADRVTAELVLPRPAARPDAA